MKWIALSLPATLLLTACGSEPAEQAVQADGTASGQVLEGSISDAMLPLDTITSQSPPVKEAAAASSGSAESSSAAPAEEKAPEPDAEQSPAAEPAEEN